MGSPNKSMPLTELSDRYKAIEELIRELAKDSGIDEEQVAKSVTGRFRGYQHVGTATGRLRKGTPAQLPQSGRPKRAHAGGQN